jgi:hypothetical protein
MTDVSTLNAGLDRIRKRLVAEGAIGGASAELARQQENALGYIQDFIDILSMHGGLDLSAGGAVIAEFEGYLDAVRLHGGRIQQPINPDLSTDLSNVRYTKVLFFDIDGVVNSERTCAAFKGRPHCFTGRDLNQFDWVAIGLIRALCIATGAAIVLSSSWRYDHEAADVGRALGLNIIGATPKTNDKSRGDEVAMWLENNPHVTQYAIVDDIDAFHKYQQRFFVKTNDYEGLSFSNYVKLKEILK